MKKSFRLNVTVSYSKGVSLIAQRHLTHSVLKNFAWLYRLDFFIDEDTKVFGDIESVLYQTTDFVYFKSNEETKIDFKALKTIINQVFSYNDILLGGTEVFCQTQSVSREFPFPKDFYRALNYPYIEEHKGNQTSIKLSVEILKEVLPELYNS